MYYSCTLLAALATFPMVFSATTYSQSKTFTFTSGIPSDLVVSNYTVNSKPKAHQFVQQNVFVKDGFLNLLVNGGQQKDEVVWSGEVSTAFTIESASVETYAILSEEAGVCNGMFMYESDHQEIDIEWLSSPKSKANTASGRSRSLFYTNQAVKKGGKETDKSGAPPSDATSKVNNYRIDWDSSSTSFYVNGVHQYTFTTNVPTTTKAFWVWNNWSDGNVQWPAGPPKSDAYFKIQKIVMHYNPGS